MEGFQQSGSESLEAEPPGFSPDELQQFARDGYVVVRGLAAPEMCRHMLECTRAGLASRTGPLEYEADLHYPGAPASRALPGGDTIRRLKEAHGRDPAFTQWVSSPPLVARLEQLLGPRVVMPLAHHNCIMTKHPRFSSETGWHQDIRYWSFERPDLVSVWLALVDETPQNGCLHLIPGTHTQTFRRDQFDDALFLRPDLAENAALIARAVPAALRAGDVLFFHSRTFHAASQNHTDQTKYSVVFTFRPQDNSPLPRTRSSAHPELLLPTYSCP
ncbi:MAG: phytanoyl-CoA dioxygenase family protein [Planctomycetales bacterium]